MLNKQIVFASPWVAEVRERREDVPALGRGQAWVRKLYTLISPGTELACLSGHESWFDLPGVPGYASVSEVLQVGEGVQGFAAGDVVFHYGDHSAYQAVDTNHVFVKAPKAVPLQWVPFVRMANVAFTSLRVSSIELGDAVAVTGLGLVGNMAAQLAKLQGANVIGIDLSRQRLKQAEACGIDHVLFAGDGDVRDRVSDLTGGEGVSALIEATGVPQAAVDALPLIAKYGELILLGSPRSAYKTDVTDVLNYVHLDGRGCITFKGAHEWRFPVRRDPFVKHSLARNSAVVLDLIGRGRLKIEPLISHVLKPEEAAGAYLGLRDDKDRYSGVLFDWSAD
ncbi:Threonine dehydrogenase [Paenibacillus sp. UNC496MF]|uniref:zinc-dependent alcohol dehydrogenase n=1 Tax=Paenibacillus sp. UNC496MF TaxID=1502753 RepID=UPI0008E824C5|nr:zinc-binding alcohol dehydrogenase [Paenibacillus sp. UNC496MF]SFJ14014.1 Threonine dehydrogenase [Paenibacillus sp. UNC496MF]